MCDWDIGNYNNHQQTKHVQLWVLDKRLLPPLKCLVARCLWKNRHKDFKGTRLTILRPRPVHKIGGPATSSPIIWYSSRFCQCFSLFPSKMGKSSCDSSQLWLKMIDPSLFFYSSIRCSSLFSAISGASQLNFVSPSFDTKTQQQLGCTFGTSVWHSRVTRVTDQGDQNQLSWNVGPQKSHL